MQSLLNDTIAKENTQTWYIITIVHLDIYGLNLIYQCVVHILDSFAIYDNLSEGSLKRHNRMTRRESIDVRSIYRSIYKHSDWQALTIHCRRWAQYKLDPANASVETVQDHHSMTSAHSLLRPHRRIRHIKYINNRPIITKSINRPAMRGGSDLTINNIFTKIYLIRNISHNNKLQWNNITKRWHRFGKII